MVGLVGGDCVASVLNSTSMALLEKSLDAVWQRQQVIANNIANAATPGYKSQHLEFETLLERKLEASGDDEDSTIRAIGQVKPKVVRDESTSSMEDGNNVDLDHENIEMARAQMQYSYLTNSISAQIKRLKYVVSEGRG